MGKYGLSGLTVFGAVFGARHYCHIVFVCSWAKSAHIFGGRERNNYEHEPQCQLHKPCLYKIRLIAPNKISLGIFPISFPPRPFYHPHQDFLMSLSGFDISEFQSPKLTTTVTLP